MLYFEEAFRPNVPVNVLVGLEALKPGFGWSDQEPYDNYCYDLQVRYALGNYLAHQRDGHNSRSAVEAIMRSVKHAFPAGKLPVRGQFNGKWLLCGAIFYSMVKFLYSVFFLN